MTSSTHYSPKDELVNLPFRTQLAKLLFDEFAPEHYLDFENKIYNYEYYRVADRVIALLASDKPVTVDKLLGEGCHSSG